MSTWEYFSCWNCNYSLGDGPAGLTDLGVTHVICDNCKEVNKTDCMPFSKMDKATKKKFWFYSTYLSTWSFFIIFATATLIAIGQSIISDGDLVGGIIPLIVSIALPILFIFLRKKMIQDKIDEIEKLQKEMETLIDSVS